MKQVNAEVCVLGGGPAGATAARRLAMLGHSVVLVEKKAFPRPHIGESLTGSVLPLLEVLKLREAVEREDFLRTRTAVVRWAGTTESRDTFGEPGFQVDRSRFDALMLESAKGAGAVLFQPAKAVEIVPNSGQKSIVFVRDRDGDTVRVDCDLLVDATGRGSVLGGSRSLSGARTVALYAYWRNASAGGPETQVEAGPREWFWGAPLPDGLFNATVFIDTDRFKPGVTNAGLVEGFYHRLIRSSELLSDCLAGATAGEVHVCDATCACSGVPIRNNVLKTGEAAFTIDPLSSQGVQTAIGSALHVAAVVHTMLERPADSALAQEFYVQRYRRSVTLHKFAAAALYADAAAKYQTNFWFRRCVQQRVGTETGTRRFQTELRPESVLRVHPGATFVKLPIMNDTFVCPADAVSIPDLQEPIVFLGAFEVVPLLRMLNGPTRCNEVFRLWARSMPESQVSRVLKATLELGLLRLEVGCCN